MTHVYSSNMYYHTKISQLYHINLYILTHLMHIGECLLICHRLLINKMKQILCYIRYSTNIVNGECLLICRRILKLFSSKLFNYIIIIVQRRMPRNLPEDVERLIIVKLNAQMTQNIMTLNPPPYCSTVKSDSNLYPDQEDVISNHVIISIHHFFSTTFCSKSTWRLNRYILYFVIFFFLILLWIVHIIRCDSYLIPIFNYILTLFSPFQTRVRSKAIDLCESYSSRIPIDLCEDYSSQQNIDLCENYSSQITVNLCEARYPISNQCCRVLF